MDDNVSGFAIDRGTMDLLLIKWFDGSYLDIIGWREKARKWDEWITVENRQFRKDDIIEWELKAKKWDVLKQEFESIHDSQL